MSEKDGWREVSGDEVLQPGAHVEMNTTTGKNFVREDWASDDIQLEMPPAADFPEDATLTERPGKNGKPQLAIVGRERKREDRNTTKLPLLYDDKGTIKPCEYNVVELLGSDARYSVVHWDEFRCRLLVGARDWNDHDAREALCRLQSEQKVPKFSLGQVHNGINALAYSRRRDSLRDYLTGLPKWDQTPRIEHAFAEAWGAPDSSLTRAASTNFFIAMAARAMKPGAQVDTLWAFEGPQGAKKSKSFRTLGGEWHAEINAQVGTTDFLRELRGLWIAELSELDSLRGKEATTVKRLLSAPTDRFVEKYERNAVAYPRRAVFVATTNEAAYWQDSTGARRLVPIRCGEIDIDMIQENRERWFAEALHLFEAGATWWEFPSEIHAAQDDRQQVDPWEDTLRALMANGRTVQIGFDSVLHQPITETVNWPAGWVASAEIMEHWLKLAPLHQGKDSGTRLGKVMRRLGFDPKKFGKARERGWLPKEQAGTQGQDNE